MSEPIGVVLAGGAGRRIGGAKAVLELAGRPLISYPLRALQAVLQEVVVLAKDDTVLPDDLGASVWTEPADPRHPLAAILWALERAGGRPVLVCAGDLPLISPPLVARLAQADAGNAPAVLAAAAGRMQPLLGRYLPAASKLLRKPGDEVSLMAAAATLAPRLVEVDDPDELLNVNTPADLRRAEAIASRR